MQNMTLNQSRNRWLQVYQVLYIEFGMSRKLAHKFHQFFFLRMSAPLKVKKEFREMKEILDEYFQAQSEDEKEEL